MSLKWAYGVTTVPERIDDLLPKTLASLKAAGFGSPRLFIDGPSYGLPYGFSQLKVTERSEKVRTYGNWLLAIWELWLRDPDADRYAIFQDDFVTYRNLRQYLNTVPYNPSGYWNLYTYPDNEGAPGWHLSNQLGWGAVGLVFSRQVLGLILSTHHMWNRVSDPQRGWKSIDGAIIESAQKQKLVEFVHTPSLVQHTGHLSVSKNNQHPLATSFMGEDYDAMEFLKCSATK